MSDKKDFIIYSSDQDETLLYHVDSKQSFIIKGSLNPDNLDNYKNEIIKKNNNGQKFYGFCFLEVDKLFRKKKVTQIFSLILSYLSFPALLIGLAVRFENIKDSFALVNDHLIYNDLVRFFLAAFPIFILSLMLHELGHAIVAVSKGIPVPEIGIGFRKKRFLAYTKILRMDKINLDKDKVFIYLGGVSANALLAALCLYISLISSSIILKVALVVNLMIIIFNFSIFRDSDGVDILKVLLKHENISKISENNVKIIVMAAAVFLNLFLPMLTIAATLLWS